MVEKIAKCYSRSPCSISNGIFDVNFSLKKLENYVKDAIIDWDSADDEDCDILIEDVTAC